MIFIIHYHYDDDEDREKGLKNFAYKLRIFHSLMNVINFELLIKWRLNKLIFFHCLHCLKKIISSSEIVEEKKKLVRSTTITTVYTYIDQ